MTHPELECISELSKQDRILKRKFPKKPKKKYEETIELTIEEIREKIKEVLSEREQELNEHKAVFYSNYDSQKEQEDTETTLSEDRVTGLVRKATALIIRRK